MTGNALRFAIISSSALLLWACGNGVPDPIAAPPPSSAPPAQSVSFDVLPCFTQMVRPGQTLASLVVPDVLTLDFSRPAGFPNGRDLDDPVIDRTLAMIFLDLGKHDIDVLHRLPLNPPANDRPLRAAFPFVAPAWGGDRPTNDGTNFNFRTDPESAFVRVDRQGMPAIATALIGASQRIPYNDDSPADDLKTAVGGTYTWVPELASQLKALTDALADDLRGAGLSLCARPE